MADAQGPTVVKQTIDDEGMETPMGWAYKIFTRWSDGSVTVKENYLKVPENDSKELIELSRFDRPAGEDDLLRLKDLEEEKKREQEQIARPGESKE